jgi:hypothetical protein
MFRKTPLVRKRQGSAMVLSMFAVILLIIAGIGLLRLALDARISAVRGASMLAARSAADAGLAKALYEMNLKLEDRPWDNSGLPSAADVQLEGCNATYSYSVTGNPGSGFAAECTGRSGGIQRTVRCELPVESLYKDLIMVTQDILLTNNCTVSAWDSRTGETVAYQSRMGTLATEAEGADIDMGSNTVVNGDVYVGVDGDPDAVIDGGTITGSTYALEEDIDLPVLVPPALPNKGNISVNGNMTIGPSNSGRYGSIQISNNKTLTISGGDVILNVTGNIDLRNSSSIVIDEDASLMLYVGGDITTMNNADFNNKTQVPSKLKIIGTGVSQEFYFKNKSDMFALIVAPEATVEMKNSADIYGAYICGNFQVKNNANIYYDVALGMATVYDGIRFIIRYWSEE